MCIRDRYRMGGYNIVLDTCSGSIHSVDEVAYDIISMLSLIHI